MKQVDRIYKALANGIVTFTQGHAIHTPRALVEEILGKIKLRGNILVMFNIEFVVSLVYTCNIDPKTITFYSDSEDKTEFAKNLGVKYITTLGTNMKFDVVLANPPYQSDVKGDASLWPLFIQQNFNLVKDQGTVAMIVPSVFGLPGPNIRKGKINCWTEYLQTKKLKVLNIGECSKHFKGVGLSPEYFGYFIAENTQDTTTPTSIVTLKEQFTINIANYDFLPARGSQIDFSIVGKIQDLGRQIGTMPISRGGGYPENGLGGNVMVFKKARYQPYIKCVDFDFTGCRDFRKEITDFGWMSIPAQATEKSAKSVFFSKLFIYYSSLMFSVTFNQGFHQSLPKLDLTKVWTDSDIYKLVGLNAKEIAYIESNS